MGNKYCLSCYVKNSHKKCTNDNTNDWIECRVCGYRAKEIAVHVKNVHDIEPKEYGITKCESSRNRLKGENNPGYQHGGKLSAWSEKSDFYSKESHQNAIKKSHKSGKNTFMRNFYASDDEYSKAQARTLDWFIDKYGEEDGKVRHAVKTEKWIKSYKKQNYSKISQELFVKIHENLPFGNFYYATNDREEMKEYTNKEYRIMTTNRRGVLPDFYDDDTKRIIEFDGDYWHSDAVANPTREKERDSSLIESGYKILRIKEKDYYADKQGTVQKCINFLTS